ncbi:unnamed protein product [Acanthosepion pharaonis]|uniref:Uncharacterized protein n=1 Tax=Acanthosepion pharaonis TaxID=158019 RepID=A0A812E751_ACAPH|nr:unnamed protein product [Sepia pharaonis]
MFFSSHLPDSTCFICFILPHFCLLHPSSYHSTSLVFVLVPPILRFPLSHPSCVCLRPTSLAFVSVPPRLRLSPSHLLCVCLRPTFFAFVPVPLPLCLNVPPPLHFSHPHLPYIFLVPQPSHLPSSTSFAIASFHPESSSLLLFASSHQTCLPHPPMFASTYSGPFSTWNICLNQLCTFFFLSHFPQMSLNLLLLLFTSIHSKHLTPPLPLVCLLPTSTFLKASYFMFHLHFYFPPFLIISFSTLQAYHHTHWVPNLPCSLSPPYTSIFSQPFPFFLCQHYHLF